MSEREITYDRASEVEVDRGEALEARDVPSDGMGCHAPGEQMEARAARAA